ncbi:exodeoxyribonuclease VII small subunit [Alphaproteobacteria bacterium]|jgi:exodeoxyribonuclease VII small subunit|nr:exodeoxyribonuclease VII small subunit [Alphaproteobacteria bacterium]|tara:strand:- start:433 stop:645 length:213 start_codon:yes stop_codon:yes gene_type:complete
MTENKKDITFEQALNSLEEIVDQLNDGEMELEKAISAYEKGMKLKNICEAKLKNAQERIELIQTEKKLEN